jgi:hypothetical protein
MEDGRSMRSELWLRNLKRKNHSEDMGVDGIILKWILEKKRVMVWTGFIWLRIGTSGGLL